MEEPEVSRREITADTVREICRLRVAPGQEGFVAPVAESIAEAHFSPLAWFRAVYAGDTPVGFVMLEDDPASRQYFRAPGQGLRPRRRRAALRPRPDPAGRDRAADQLGAWRGGPGGLLRQARLRAHR